MRKKKRVCFFTGSRSEYGLIRDLLRKIEKDKIFALYLSVIGSHFSKEHGNTKKEILKDKFKNISFLKTKIYNERADLTLSLAILSKKISKYLKSLKPDLVVFMGDRFEMLPVINTCLLMNIPIAHISGGNISEGSVDNQIRNMATKASHIHFVANKEFRNRLIKMGEESWRICVSGEPGLDGIRKKIVNKKKLFNNLKINKNKKIALFAYHPETLLEEKKFKVKVKKLFNNLRLLQNKFKIFFIITYPNNDSGYKVIIHEIKKFAKGNFNCSVIRNLGRNYFLSCMKYCDFLIGNSSSSFYEAPAFNLPAIVVGDRQKGRLAAKNIHYSSYESKKIILNVKKCLKYNRNKKIRNPYGNYKAIHKIIKMLQKILKYKTTKQILSKKFID